jgi:hypothetical protein
LKNAESSIVSRLIVDMEKLVWTGRVAQPLPFAMQAIR